MVGHQFQVAAEGQAKARALARLGDLEILTLAPERYREAETRWRFASLPMDPRFLFRIERVRMAWSGPGKWYLQWYPDAERTVADFQPDVIDLWEEPWGLLSAQFCGIRNRVCPKAALVSETEQNISRVLPPPFEWFRRRTFQKADYLIGRSVEAVDVARQKGYQGPAQVVGNGVDLELFSPSPHRQSQARFGMDAEAFHVGYAGRLVPEKGVLDLLEALSGLPAEYHLWMSGSGVLEPQLQQHPRVRCLGSLSRSDLAKFFSAIDVLVLPSRTTPTWKEQFGRVLIEAQACGAPVIASRSGSMPGVLGSSALVFEEGSVSELQNLLRKLRQEPALRLELAEAGKARVEAFYSWDAIAHQMRGVYRECVLRRRARLHCANSNSAQERP
jgi:glycosyltransferase involved in cell wall biosynthesis